jgi:hypothetical protein
VIIEQATIDDLPVILAMRQEASDWLAQRGIHQWATAWPTPQAQSERILSSIRAGETWMVRDKEATTTTVALDTFSDPRLWTPEEQKQPSMYLHRLIVRKYAGLGADVIEWASRRTRQRLGPLLRCSIHPGYRAGRATLLRVAQTRLDQPSQAALIRCRDDLGVVRREDFVNNRLEGRAQVVKDPLLCRVLQVERLVALLVPTREEVRKHECFIVGKRNEYLVMGRPRRST